MNKHIYLFLLMFLSGIIAKAFEQEKFILINQFGYLPDAQKIAVIRSPRLGPDAASAETFPGPGNEIRVMKLPENNMVYSGAPVLVTGRDNDGYYQDNIDKRSGDIVWHFDFSSVTAAGTYYLMDVATDQESFEFKIAEDVYVDLLNVAFKNFYFQRFNIAKEMPYCYDAIWADDICYTQEKQALNYMKKDDRSLMRDVSGGWFDAGDLNKYVNFMDHIFRNLLLAYTENPGVWDDNMGIPESGNGIPDILDEIKWGLDWMIKMQNEDGSVLSVVGGTDGASPPSRDTGTRYYGPENTSSTLSFALCCAYASQVFAQEPQQSLKDFAADLRVRAEKAWDWAEANPNVKFYNNDDNLQPGSAGLCAGQNEVEDIKPIKLRAAVYLFGLTRDDKYGHYIRDHYNEFPMVAWSGTLNQYFIMDHEACFYLNSLPDLPSYLSTAINALSNRMRDNTFEYSLPMMEDNMIDGYMSYIEDYNWGSNSYKAAIGNSLCQVANSGWIDEESAKAYRKLSAHYMHYICGVNPMQFVYMTNMNRFGASQCVTEIFHSWFGEGTKWARNAAPGYIPGGPNARATDIHGVTHFPSYTPDAKCYIDFNNVYPGASWEMTENSLGYQAPFIRLVARFVPNKREVSVPQVKAKDPQIKIIPNPVKDNAEITLPEGMEQAKIAVLDVTGRLITEDMQQEPVRHWSFSSLENGIYIVSATNGKEHAQTKIILRR